MRSPSGAFIFLALMLLFDTYVFQAIKTVSQSASPKTKGALQYFIRSAEIALGPGALPTRHSVLLPVA